MKHYIKVTYQGVPVSHRRFSDTANPLTEPSGEKDYYVPATIIGDDVFDSDIQVKDGPVFDVPGKTITYSVRNKTAQELNDEKTSDVSGLLADRRLKAFFRVAAEQWGMTSAQLKTSIKNKM